MVLPDKLQAFIENEAKKYSPEKLQAASDDLTKRYRERDIGNQAFMSSDIHRVAYLVARLPATYAVVKRVLSQIPFLPSTLLDLGSGPGTVLWAAAETFPSLNRATCVEQDAAMIGFAKKIAATSDHRAIRDALWQTDNIVTDPPGPSDLIVLSYAIGELSEDHRRQLVSKAWSATKQCLVIIEPGTMAGFAEIRSSRAELIAAGAHIAAPCPHNKACPMPANDWCHFAERLDRTSIHRKLKSGTLSYEDEKYSYVIASKAPCSQVESRILRHPGKHGGHISFELCTSTGLQDVIVSKRDKEAYKIARKLEWGDPFT